jgi:tetratricopeptide (TPR) repeat protein
MTLEKCAEWLADALGVVGAETAPSHYTILSWALERARGGSEADGHVRLPVVVVDGLDEAGSPEAMKIADELLAKLASHARVIVGTRELPSTDEGQSLLQSLGPPALEVDLSPPADGLDPDLRGYALMRLTRPPEGAPDSSAMQPEAVADEVTALAARSARAGREGGFLLARVLTSQLIARPLDTSVHGWEEQLATSVERAFEQDLVAVRPLERDGRELPHADRELLTALAYSYGPGFPADDVWPSVASALSPTRTSYERLDAFWALDEHGRYVTASSLDGQGVYRLHHRLAEALRGTSSREDPRRADVAREVLAVYERFLGGGHAATQHRYLWHFAWLHAVDGGDTAIETLARLADHDASLLPDIPRALDQLGVRYSEVGRRQDAVAPTERAIEIYERLAASNPAFEPDLARSLNSLAERYGEIGRTELGELTWQAVLDRFAGDRRAAAALRLVRRRPEQDTEAMIRDVLEAHDLDPATDPRLTGQIHAACRALRSRSPGLFDERWHGPEPAWLLLDDAVMHVCQAWLATPTWRDSRDFVADNANVLFSDAARAALHEIGLLIGDDRQTNRHLELLDRCTTDEADTAYAPLLIAETTSEWLKIDDVEQSRQFLESNADQLLTPNAIAEVGRRNDPVRHAVLTLAAAGDTDLAFRLLLCPDDIAEALEQARRTNAGEKLAAIAQIARAYADTDEQSASAALHLAIALAIASHEDESIEIIKRMRRIDTDPTPLIQIVTDAIAHQPEHAVALAAQINALTNADDSHAK